MGIKAKIIGQTEIKGGGDLFHDFFTQRPHHLQKISPDICQNFTLLKGKLGATGSIIRWDYTHEGKPSFAKQRIDVFDEERKSIVFHMLDGDLLEHNKNMIITYHVDAIDGGSLVTWTIDYEKKEVDSPHPGSFINFLLYMSEQIDNHHVDKYKAT